MVDARYIDAALTPVGRLVAADVTDVIADLEVDVHEAAGGPARYGFSRVAWMLAAMDDEPDVYRLLGGVVDGDDDDAADVDDDGDVD